MRGENMPVFILRAIASTVDVTGRRKRKNEIVTEGEVPAIFEAGARGRIKAQGFSEPPVKRTTVDELVPHEHGIVFTKYHFTSHVTNPKTEKNPQPTRRSARRAERRKARRKR